MYLNAGPPTSELLMSSSDGHFRMAVGHFTLEALLLHPLYAVAMSLHRHNASYNVILLSEAVIVGHVSGSGSDR